MALDKAGLTSALKTIFENVDANSTPAAKAASIADAIDTFVKTGTVSVTVATTGSPTAQTGSGTGSIS